MASLKALGGGGMWSFPGDFRSYLLCCFSFAPRPSPGYRGRDADAELEQRLSCTVEISDASVSEAAEDEHHHRTNGANSAAEAESKPAHSDASHEAFTNDCTDEKPVANHRDAAISDSAMRVESVTVSAQSVTLECVPSSTVPSLPLGSGAANSDGKIEPHLAFANCLDSGQQSLTLDAAEGSRSADPAAETDQPAEKAERSDSVNQDAEDRLFDISDLQEYSRCGRIHVTLDYSATRMRMNVTVHEAAEIPNEERGGSTNTYVSLTLLPGKKIRHKTKVVRSNENPAYGETFQFKLNKDDLNRAGLRIRLYGSERFTRERLIGECILRFSNINLDRTSSDWLTLEPRTSLSETDRSSLDRRSRSSSAASSSSQSMDIEGFPELLLSLAYNAVTGRLTVDVHQGTNLKYLTTNRPPDTYVRLTLMTSGGKELARSSTSVRKMSPNPVYREKFMFQVVEAQLSEVSLMVSVYAKRSLRREELIGWFILGYSNSGEEESTHWNDMRASNGTHVERWHMLAEP